MIRRRFRDIVTFRTFDVTFLRAFDWHGRSRSYITEFSIRSLKGHRYRRISALIIRAITLSGLFFSIGSKVYSSAPLRVSLSEIRYRSTKGMREIVRGAGEDRVHGWSELQHVSPLSYAQI